MCSTSIRRSAHSAPSCRWGCTPTCCGLRSARSPRPAWPPCAWGFSPARLSSVTSLTFEALVDRARGLAAGRRRAVLGITGAPAAGKTTLAEELVKALAGERVAHVPMDGFHLADVELVRLG